jgi:hypothetical protein
MIRGIESDAVALYIAFWDEAKWTMKDGRAAPQWSRVPENIKQRWRAVAEKARNL